jgi:hypothetical protein
MRVLRPVVLVIALLAGVFTQSPGLVAPLSRAASAAPAGGDAVSAWNAHAGWPPRTRASLLSMTGSTNLVCTQ